MPFLAEYIFQGTHAFQPQKRPLEMKTLRRTAPCAENPPASGDGCETGGDRLRAEDREDGQRELCERVSDCMPQEINWLQG